MPNLYRQFCFTFIGALTLMLFLATHQLSAQQTVPGVVRMKVTESLASTLEQQSLSRDKRGPVVTGIQSLDQLNKQFNVRRYERVFPYAGKHEARHRRYGLHLWYEVRLDKGLPVSQVLQSYQSARQILRVEPVYKKTLIRSHSPGSRPVIVKEEESSTGMLPGSSNDPKLSSQWHYHNTGQTGGTQGADIRLIDAWKIETGKDNVIVSITDGGVDITHPDLAPNLWVNSGEVAGNKIDDDNNGYVDDIHGYSFVQKSEKILPDPHGTHVAGTVAAVTNNSTGVAGVAGGSGAGDGVRIMSCAVFHADTLADGFAEAYVYSADNGAVISQNSWGYTMPGVFEQVVLDAIDYFIAEAGKNELGQQSGPLNGGLPIFSAGNYNDEGNFYPASYQPVIAVASSTHEDKRAKYSNYGSWIDITAPGGETYEATQQGVISTLPGGQYGFYMGTSMACPHVSGVAALILSKFGRPGLTPHAVRQRLLQSVDNIDLLNPGFEGKLGSGRVNALRALRSNEEVPPAAITDLKVVSKDVGEITIGWSAPGVGADYVSAYDLRYSTSPITPNNFASATTVQGLPEPKAPGSPETFTVKDLTGGILHYFAVRSQGFEGNFSAISNVVSETSALTPLMHVSAGSLNKDLKTAETSPEVLVIRNDGQGPLRFNISVATAVHPFAEIDVSEGIIQPAESKAVTVTFDAAGLLAGTYRQNLTITSNDPANKLVPVALTLNVTDNGAPIAAVTPGQIDFKSVQIPYSQTRKVSVSNAGSEALVITKVTSTHPSFRAAVKVPVTIASFQDAALAVVFAPSAVGEFAGEIVFEVNDPENPTLRVAVEGEGLQEAPVVASPGSLTETLERGIGAQRTVTLQNNGSDDRNYRIEVSGNRLATDKSSKSSRKSATPAAVQNDSARARQQSMLQQHKRELSTRAGREVALLKSIGSGSSSSVKSASTGGRKTQSQTSTITEYNTGFEELNAGPLGEQNAWYATQGWNIETENPDKGIQHLRGESQTSGGSEKYALSPYLLENGEFYPQYTSASMRLNVDRANGTTWEIVPQDPWSYIATRIRINPDRSIEAFVIDNDYEFHWKQVPAEIPSGYFDLAIEYDNRGSDTSGFPTYHLFINNQHVFSGTGLASGIGQIAFASSMESNGPVLDIDDFKVTAGEYLPHFIIPSPMRGTIPAGGNVNVSVDFDAAVMKYGSYSADMLIHLDENDTLTVPAALTVTGPPSMIWDAWAVYMQVDEGEDGWQQITLTNTGGREIVYSLDTDVPGLSVSPASGVLAVRENKAISITFTGAPGFYTGQVALRSDAGHDVIFPVDITIYENEAEFIPPSNVTFDINAGEITTKSITVKNGGPEPVSFHVSPAPDSEGFLTVEPASGTVEDSLDIILTIDTRELSPGTKNWWLDFTTNDSGNRQSYTSITLNVLPDTITAGKITRELWTNVPGKEVSAIPLATAPQSTTSLKMFESPANEGDNYGSRIRGYIRPAATGFYTFYISSDDQSELWLSEDENEENKKRVAWVSGVTNLRQWDKFPSQQSEVIYLEGNRKYYIEALHKEGTRGDHLSVGWYEQEMSFERPIPGSRLIPYNVISENASPVANILSPANGQIFPAPANIKVTTSIEDADGHIVKVELFEGNRKLATDISPPFEFDWNNVPEGMYSLVVKATDNHGAMDSAAVQIVVGEEELCSGAGLITREQWDNVEGTRVTDIPLYRNPSQIQTLPVFESPSDIGDNYGARISGYLCVPATGEYTFWIASNDRSELWLSSDASPENKVLIAHVPEATKERQWKKHAAQQSRRIFLQKGTRYYIEALHKEGSEKDHLAVGWQLPNGAMERPIPGKRLLPYERLSQPLSVVFTSPMNGQTYVSPATVDIAASVADDDADVATVEFYSGSEKIGEDAIAPYTLTWKNVAAGSYALTAVVIDKAGTSAVSPSVDIIVEAVCTASGTVTREYWKKVKGSSISNIPLHTAPDAIEELTVFEAPASARSNYGERIRGYICPPETGEYFFWISSSEQSELRLSTNEDPQNTRRIAMVRGATNAREWDKHPFQSSHGITLRKGQTYYIEALHTHGKGTSHLAVGWQLPDGTMERPIAGSRLSPFAAASAALPAEGEINPDEADMIHADVNVRVYPNPVEGQTLNIVINNDELPENSTREIVIRQLTGMSVYTEKVTCAGNCESQVDVRRNLPPGLYILQVRVGDRTFTEKLIVK